MSLVINSNIAAMDAHRNLVNSSNAMAKSMQRLSSGLRINSAADDAAGLAISQSMTGQINGLDQAQRNAQDGISLVQTADGTLNNIQQMLQRVRELAVQYNTGTLSSSDQAAISSEVTQLASEIARVGVDAQFNKSTLFSASQTQTAVSFQVGANDGEVIAVQLTTMDLLVPDSKTGFCLLSIASIDNEINAVSTQRAAFGAVQNRLQYALDNLSTYEQNLTSARSSIQDVDMAAEMTNYTKEQILQQAGTSMLAQANQSPQSVLKLRQ